MDVFVTLPTQGMKQICVTESAADSDAESFQRRFEIKLIRNVKNLGFSPPKLFEPI